MGLYALLHGKNISRTSSHRFMCCVLFLCLAVYASSPVHAQKPVPEIPSLKAKVSNLDDGIIHSQRWNSGVPLGGIGCGTFQILTDGTISQATINNNWNRPTGDLKGCFASVWTSAGGRVLANALTLKSGYGLPTIGALNYRGLFPQAFLDYPDPKLPITLRLRAFSPLVPQDIKNSSLPVALFVFTLKNESRGPVEASIALSWENLLGVGGTLAKGAFADRTGNTVTVVPSTNGLFGLRLASPEKQPADPADRFYYNARGSYALFAQADTPDAQLTTASWNALDKSPAWWTQFTRDGTVDGTVEAGKEGTIHPAGVIAFKVSLRDRETRDIPFVVAWYTPRLYVQDGAEYGHLYQKSFGDAVDAARYALENRLNLAALTDEWQNRLLRSTLPPWLVRRLINDAGTLFTNTVLTRDSGLGGTAPGPPLFTSLQRLGSSDVLGAMDERMSAHTLYASWFPAQNAEQMRRYAGVPLSGGAIGWADGALDTVIGDIRAVNTSTVSAAALVASSSAFVFQVYQEYLWTGDQKLLNTLYPAAKHALEYLAASEGQNPDPENRLPAAFLLGERMADSMQDKRFGVQCAEWRQAAQKRALAERWTGRFFRKAPGSEASFAYALLGQWMTETVEAGDIFPTDILDTSLGALQTMHDKAAPFGPPMEVRPDGMIQTPDCTTATAIMAQAALYTIRGQVDAGLDLMHTLDRTLTEKQHSPWQWPQTFNATDGSPGNERSSVASPASWNYLAALEGFCLDVPAGRLTIAPRLPAGMKSLAAPLFAPTFWGWLEYRPGKTRSTLLFRLDRFLPIAAAATPPARSAKEETAAQSSGGLLSGGTGLVLKQVVLPGIPSASDAPLPEVTASLVRSPLPGKVTRDIKGRLVFTFDAPVVVTTGQRLEFILR